MSHDWISHIATTCHVTGRVMSQDKVTWHVNEGVTYHWRSHVSRQCHWRSHVSLHVTEGVMSHYMSLKESCLITMSHDWISHIATTCHVTEGVTSHVTWHESFHMTAGVMSHDISLNVSFLMAEGVMSHDWRRSHVTWHVMKESCPMTYHLSKWVTSPASTSFVNASCRTGQRLTSRRANYHITAQSKPSTLNPTFQTQHKSRDTGSTLRASNYCII